MSLVRHGLGVAVIDEFSAAGVYMPGLTRIPLEEKTGIRIYAIKNRGRSFSHQRAMIRTHRRARSFE